MLIFIPFMIHSSCKPKTWKISWIYCFSYFFREKKLSRISFCRIFRGNNFREFAQNSRKSRKFLSAKVSSFKVCRTSLEFVRGQNVWNWSSDGYKSCECSLYLTNVFEILSRLLEVTSYQEVRARRSFPGGFRGKIIIRFNVSLIEYSHFTYF